MKVALFGGSFDPVHCEHIACVRAAQRALGLDRVIVMPSCVAPHKGLGAAASPADRLQMCRIAFRDLSFAEVSDYEISQSGVSYSYLTCRRFAQMYPHAERWFLLGADMLEDFFTWREPDDILTNVRLAACGREGWECPDIQERFEARFHTSYDAVAFTGAKISSCAIRVDLAFGRVPGALDGEVLSYIRARGLYAHPAVAPALALEKMERREHSYRVARMAAERARSAKIAESKAILAAALHDCAKYVPVSSPLLEDFSPPADVPAPVIHQYSGAYLARHAFGIDDEEVLDAIRYHTSGRPGMTPLGKLIFLADMLEEGRSFEGVERLRELFKTDLDACFYSALEQQVGYLKAAGKPVYPLTEEAFLWEKAHKNKK